MYTPNEADPLQSVARLRALSINVTTLLNTGASVLIPGECPECGQLCFGDAGSPAFCCGYCGYGPWRPPWSAPSGAIYPPRIPCVTSCRLDSGYPNCALCRERGRRDRIDPP